MQTRNQGQLFLGIAIIVIGVLFLIGNLFDVDVSAFCWPVGLILLGVWLMFRPRMAGDTQVTQRLFGEIERVGPWQVQDEEFWAFIAELELDLIKADIPPGETHLRVLSFVGDLKVYVPEDVGVSVSATSFVSTVKMDGAQEESFIMPLHWQTPNYKTAERQIRLETTCFVSDIKIRTR